MPEWVPARLLICALLEHACTSARKGKCPLPSWCYTRLCVVALIVQGDMLDATPADLLAACWRIQSGFPSCALPGACITSLPVQVVYWTTIVDVMFVHYPTICNAPPIE